MIKCCVSCRVEKPAASFHRSRCNPDGLHKQCKACRKEASQRYYENNKDAISRQAQARYSENRERVIAAVKKYVERNRERVAARQTAYYLANKEKRQQYRRGHYEQNLERYARSEVQRRALIKNLPGWADTQSIELLYRLARKMSEETGVLHHVDHIVPLRHPQVCGLHVQNNLRVVPAAVNLKKKNRFEEESL